MLDEHFVEQCALYLLQLLKLGALVRNLIV